MHDADALGAATMALMARETRLSETSFVVAPTREGADYRHRIFMMSGEIPFAGHPSLGTAVARARLRGEASASYVQETRPGLQPVDVEITGRHARASMLQEPVTFGPELDPGEVLPMAGLSAADAHPELPVQVVSTGVAQVLVPVADPAGLATAVPDYARIGPLLDAHAAITFYVTHVDPTAGTAAARSFSATSEMGEDPATGSAAGPLGAYVAARTGAQRLEIRQGVEMGRPSLLRAAVEGDRMRVGGDAVILVEGVLSL